VFPKKNVYSWPKYKYPVAKRGEVLPLREALARTWQGDVYTVAYEATGGPHGAHRFAHETLKVGVTPRCVFLALDVDHPVAKPEERACTPDERAELAAQVEAFRATVPGVVAYHTRGGVRLIALLAEPVVIAGTESAAVKVAVKRWKSLVSRWIARAARAGVLADPACVDWTRFFRLPHGVRDKEPQRWPWQGSPAEMGYWPALDTSDEAVAEDRETLASIPELTVLVKHLEPEPDPKAKRAPKAPRPDAPRSAPVTPRVAPEPLADAPLAALAQELAEALDRLPHGRHTARLALVGALIHHLERGQVEALVCEVVRLRGRGTVEEWGVDRAYDRAAAGDDLQGLATLRGGTSKVPPAPELARIVERLAERSTAAQWADTLARRGIPGLVSADAACAELARVVDEAVASRGAVLARLTPGTGKSRTLGNGATAVYQGGGRAVLLARDHENADELLARLRASGVPALGLRGLLSVRDASGGPACALPPEAARGIEGSGVSSVRRDLCDGTGYGERPKKPPTRGAKTRGSLPVLPPKGRDAPCSHRATCSAYASHTSELDALAREGPGVLVTVHAYAHRAHQWLRERPEGKPGLAVVDEDPDLFDSARHTPEELLAAADTLGLADPHALTPETSEWLIPLVRAVGEWARDEHLADELPEGETPRTLTTALAERAPEVLAAARAKGLTASGRLREIRLGSWLQRAVVTPGALTREGEARLRARAVAHAVVRAVLDVEARSVLARDPREARTLTVAWSSEGLRALLADPAIARVVLDATASESWLAPWLPGARVLDVHVADAREGGVVRLAVRWSHATRRHCLAAGRPVWAEVARPLAEGLRLATEGLARGSRVLVMTWKALADVLRTRDVEPGDGPEGLVRAALDALDVRGITVEWAHYGAVRGRDAWRDVDAYLAVGTPWPPPAQLHALALAARWTGDVFSLARALARAELAQAVGRGRFPRRTSPARVVVLASELPADADARWLVHALAQGRPRALGPADLAAVAGLSDRVAAALLGVGRSTVQRARRGGGPKRVTEREDTSPPPRVSGHPHPTPQTFENAGERLEPALEIPTSEGVRLVLGGTSPADAEAQAAYEDAEVAAGGWPLAPPARVVPEVALACAAAGAPLALRWRDTGDLAVSPTLPPELAAEARAFAPEIALMLGRRTPEDSVYQWPPERAEVYRERVALMTAGDALPDHLAERAAAWWAWSGPWPEREVA
jgi:hypothetical protein